MSIHDDDTVDGFLGHLAGGLSYQDGDPDTDVVAGRRMAMLRDCVSVYRHAGVIGPDGVPRPLHRSCMNRAPCWSGKGPPPDADPRAGISAPLIGRHYPVGGGRSRIALVGLNMVGYGGIGALWWTAHAAERDIARGRRVRFYFGCARYAAIVGALVEGRIAPAPDDGVAHREALRSIALVEAVKCSPEGDRSRPSDAMKLRCPPLFLRRELAILEPDVVVGLGHDAIDAVRAASSGVLDWSDRRLVHGRGTLAARDVRIVGVIHPSWPARSRSVEALLERPAAERLDR